MLSRVTFQLLVIGCLICQAYSSLSIAFPESTKLDWKPVTKNTRYCPMGGEWFLEPGLQEESFPSSTPIGATPSKSDGFLCHAAKWVTTCDFRWYGPKYITHSIHNIKPTRSDCDSALASYKSGTLINPGFPPDSCGYASVTDSEFLVIMITPHHVGVDDYRGHWVDPLFVGGECDQSYCDTIHNSSVWIPADTKKKNICGQSFTPLTVTVAYDKTKDITAGALVFKSKYHSHMEGARTCRLTYCGRTGIKFPNGEWVSLDVKTKIQEKQLLPLFKECPAGTEVRSTLQSDGAQVLTSEIQRLLDYSLCQNTWEKVDRKEPLSPLDLSYLASKSPGKGLAYTVINGTLSFAHTRYVRMWIDGPVLKELKGKRESASGIASDIWTQWFKYGDMEIGPNGLLKTKSGYKFPWHLIGMGIVDNELHEWSEANPLDHPQLPHAHSIADDSEEIFFGDTGVSKNPVELVTGWFTSWKESLAAGVVLILTVVLIYGVLRCFPVLCMPCKKPKWKKGVERSDSFEMRIFKPNNMRARV
uniref:Glycoprotein n=1 Tax=Chandipura virus TaxID=11272 RepID=A0A7H1HCD9_9RHAB|nr:glycoprotein [Chandipura virus]